MELPHCYYILTTQIKHINIARIGNTKLINQWAQQQKDETEQLVRAKLDEREM